MTPNPFQSPSTNRFVDPSQREWVNGVESSLEKGGLLHRKVVVRRPIEVTIEYFARGLLDRIIVDGKSVVTRLPIFWFHEKFEFEIPIRDGVVPAIVRIKMAPRSTRIAKFEIEINGVSVYREVDERRSDRPMQKSGSVSDGILR